ncbi:MAG TPA: class I SAM-dependent methyltransferase [Smithellaceae bacterium]|nr:class I SAM-dependent methyltransferase [Smithellaceae bacterium]HRS89652.1 class I SAM-dependent methyltransferase [Smithellaceae bacterium]HRV25205.1 class I SAM-dependent methyltransferase [Smithellaceae bacterium]
MSKKIIFPVLKRFFYPQHLFRVIKLQIGRKKQKRAFDDAQLKLFSKLLPGDFLHYGYFEDTQTKPEDISLNDIYRAQENYGWQIVNLIDDYEQPALDIGCGMGGLIALMQKKGIKVTALTPDKNQAKHIREKYLGVELLECRFEDMKADDFSSSFGTVITSESLQYLKLDQSLPIIDKILQKNGKWIVCDYFKTGARGGKSGHNWEIFTDKLAKYGFEITSERDITPHIMPTIRYVDMLSTKIGLPVKDFVLEKLKVKAPGLYYALQGALPEIEAKIKKNTDKTDPDIFAANKRYMLLVIERK